MVPNGKIIGDIYRVTVMIQSDIRGLRNVLTQNGKHGLQQANDLRKFINHNITKDERALREGSDKSDGNMSFKDMLKEFKNMKGDLKQVGTDFSKSLKGTEKGLGNLLKGQFGGLKGMLGKIGGRNGYNG